MDNEWYNLVMIKLDRIEDRVSKLEVKVSWKNMLVSGIAGFLAALGTYLLHGCAGQALPTKGYKNLEIQTQYESAVSIQVECVYPELPLEATPIDRLAAPFWGTHAGGSGFAIASRYAMTARHVVDCERNLPDSGIFQKGEPTEIILKLNDGRMLEFWVADQGKDETDDAALLVVVGTEAPFKRWVDLTDDYPQIDEEVCLVTTYPFYNHKCGPVTKYPEGDEWMQEGYVMYGLQSIPGNSGSAVYYHDKVVAINVAGAPAAGIGGGYLTYKWRHMLPVWLEWE